MQDQDPSLLQEFILESAQSLESFEQDLLALEEEGASPEVINRMFRAVHSMKGTSGYLQLNSILGVSHLGESLLDQVRKGERELTPDMVDVLLKANDALRAMLDAPDLGQSYDIGEIVQLLEMALHGEGGEPAQVSANNTAEPQSKDTAIHKKTFSLLLASFNDDSGVEACLREELEQGKSLFWIQIPEGKTDALLAAMPDLGKMVLHVEAETLIIFATVLDDEMLSCAFDIEPNAFGMLDRSEVDHVLKEKELPASLQEKAASVPKPAPTPSKPSSPARSEPASAEQPAASKPKRKGNDEGAMIKINANFLDELLRLTGNMVMSRNQLLTRYDFSDDSAFTTLSQAITEVHRSVVQTRMRQVNTLFDRFRRVVRDLSKQLGKDVELRTEGGEMELDRTILEAFGDPLTHMIRNSLDHGIETAEERQAVAKPHMATVTLKAFQESGEIIIAVCDDGRGVDVTRVKAKAVERGLLSAAQAEEMSDAKAVMLIFEPGFSTAEKLSEVSGRGVGMDVVRTNIEAIGGVIDCQSDAGQGTTIQARLPLTKAMVASSLISALVIRVGEHKLCIPQSAVNELIRVSPRDRQEKIRLLQGQEVFQHRELVLPIVSLSAALGEGPQGCSLPSNDLSGKGSVQTLIVLQHRNRLFGMMVDEIIGIEEAVVRDLPQLVSSASVFAGHTVLGDGQVVMLVDIGGVVEMMNMKFVSGPATPTPESKPAALSVGKRSDLQTMIIFNYGPTEYFCVPLELVTLVEKIRGKDIHRVGDRYYYPFKGNTIPLLFLDKHLPVTPIDRNLEYYNLILPARVKFPIGILTDSDMSVHDISERFDSRITHDKGVLGTFMNEGRLVMLLDLYALFEHDDPDHFDTSSRETCTPARILIVEDSMFYRKLNVTYLRGPGRDLTVVNDGREALLELRQNPHSYDIVVTDIEMPNMNGFELIKAIRGDPLLQELPVIALTALQDQASREKGMRLQFDEYVVKVDKDSLTSCVERYARMVQKQQLQGRLAESGA